MTYNTYDVILSVSIVKKITMESSTQRSIQFGYEFRDYRNDIFTRNNRENNGVE
nr:MAG TPA: hypothetical protein [Caudoviricetes sp.]